MLLCVASGLHIRWCSLQSPICNFSTRPPTPIAQGLSVHFECSVALFQVEWGCSVCCPFVQILAAIAIWDCCIICTLKLALIVLQFHQCPMQLAVGCGMKGRGRGGWGIAVVEESMCYTASQGLHPTLLSCMLLSSVHLRVDPSSNNPEEGFLKHYRCPHSSALSTN